MPAQPSRFRARGCRLSTRSAGSSRTAAARGEDRVDRPVAYVVDPIEVGAKLLDVGAEPGQIAKRLIETGQQRLKRHQNADAQAAVDDLAAAQAEDHDRRQAREGRGERPARACPRTPATCSALIIRAWSPVQRTSRSDSEPVALMLSTIWIAPMTPARSRPRICSIARFWSARQRLNHLRATRFKTADSHADDGQQRVAGKHHGDVDDQGQQADRRRRQLARDQAWPPAPCSSPG